MDKYSYNKIYREGIIIMEFKDYFYLFYYIPTMISFVYFTAIKIEDKYRTDKAYSVDKLPYIKVLGLCFIPIFNIYLAFNSCRMIVKSFI